MINKRSLLNAAIDLAVLATLTTLIIALVVMIGDSVHHIVRP